MKAKLIVSLLCFCLFSIYTFEAGAQTKRRRTPKSASAAITTPSGLTYLITKKGTGPQLKAGDTVILNYTGTLTNGVKFDSSYDRNEPLEFKLGAGRVIKGYDEGLAKLRVGDHAILVIPGKLAYGPKGVPNVIPPDSTLIFIIEVVDVKGAAGNGVAEKRQPKWKLDQTVSSGVGVWTSDVKNRYCSFFNREEDAITSDDQMPDGNTQLFALRRERICQRH